MADRGGSSTDVPNLRGYLQHHWAGAVAGTRLFHRGARTHSDPRVAAQVRDLAAEVDADRESLREIMRSVDVEPSRVGALAASAAETVGRLKPNGSLLRRTPLTDVVKVEALRGAVNAKRAGWQVLQVIAEEERRLDHDLLTALEERADKQLLTLQRLHLRASPSRLLSSSA